MCGIAGTVQFEAGARADAGRLRAMADMLAHRGPDGDGVHIAGPVGFSHRRLAIIDPVGGRQPLVDKETGLTITYNGEVYNYVEIRRELGEAAFETDCDTEVVLRAWRRWGPDALMRFRGMFAFAIHDPRQSKVFLVRDRLGIKPLYYKVSRSGVVFASELAAIAADQDGLEVDPDALSLYLRYGYVPAPQSIYKDVFKLEPGHYLAIDVGCGKVEKRRYWRLDPVARTVEEGAALEELGELLRETIKLYVRSDVPFGAFLSGGVDSSLVTALMSEELGGGVRTFSIGFDDKQFSELPYAKEAAEQLRTLHHQEVLAPTMSPAFLQQLAWRFGEPFSDSSALPTWMVSQVAARHVKMVLSGDGGDELFAGYSSYPAVALVRNGSFAGLYQAVSKIAGQTRVGAYAAMRSGAWLNEHHRRRDTFDAAARKRLTGAAPPEQLDQPGPAVDPVTWCQERDVATYLPDDILTKVDRMSMSHSLEVRVPLLDHKIVEFAFSLPIDLRLRAEHGGFTGKYLLKRVAERFFPRAFLDRPKWGFGIPLQNWLEGPLKPMVRDLLDSNAALAGVHLDSGQVQHIVREFYAGRSERVGQVWALLSLELWCAATAARSKQVVH